MRIFLALWAALVAVISPLSVAVAAPKSQAYVIVQRVPTPGPDYVSIELGKIDPASGLPKPIAEPSSTKDGRYFIYKVKPGAYLVSYVVQAFNWMACLNSETVRFEVAEGQALFLGKIDPTPALVEISTLPSSSMNNQHYTVFDTPRMVLTPPADLPDWKAALAGSLAAEKKLQDLPVEAATLTPGGFDTAVSPLGLRTCMNWLPGAKAWKAP